MWDRRPRRSFSFSSSTGEPWAHGSPLRRFTRRIPVRVGPCLSMWVHVRGFCPLCPPFSSSMGESNGSWFTTLQTPGPLTLASNRAQTTSEESNLSSPGQVARSRVTQPRDHSPTHSPEPWRGSTKKPDQFDPFGAGLFLWSLIHGLRPRLFKLDPVPGSSQIGPRLGNALWLLVSP